MLYLQYRDTIMGMLILTPKEEEVLRMFWERGKLFVNEIRLLYPTPRPHFNTVSTFVRALESKGYVSHEVVGMSYRYYAVVSEDEYCTDKLNTLIKDYFSNSPNRVVSTLIANGRVTEDDLRIHMVRARNMKNNN